jgi:hypothetical protein
MSTFRFALIASGSVVVLQGITGCKFSSSRPKDLRAIDGMMVRKSQGEVVIFYANETPASSSIAPIYSRVRNAISRATEDPSLGSAEKGTLSRIERSYGDDLAKFSAQVAKDSAGLESQICGEKNAGKKTGLFIFTNQLAKSGKAKFCLPNHQNGRMEEIDFKVGLGEKESQDFRYSEMPLSTIRAFMNAIDLARDTAHSKGLQSNDLAYVLISKSHGGGDMVIAPKLSYRADQLSDEALMQRYLKIASSVSVTNLKLADLILPGGQRFGSIQVKPGILLESVDIPRRDDRSPALKIGDLKIGDLRLSDDLNAMISDLKIGDLKIGDLKIGDLKVGDLKIGDLKSNDLKSNDLKIGDLKIGDLKSNDLKIGDLKSNDLKVGDLKSGDLKNDLWSETQALDAPGIQKWSIVQAIRFSGLAYSLVFFESCDSDLGLDLTFDLLYGDYLWNGSTGVGSVYFSDNRGLQYETVDYGTVAIESYFSDSLKGALDLKRTN